MKLVALILVVGTMGISASAQDAAPALFTAATISSAGTALKLPAVRPEMPAMSPELALQAYENNAERQLTDLAYSTDTTVIEADLPGTGQKGRFELRRSYQAPKSLAYGAVKFVGDNFVKNNVILKLLTSEVDHVQKGDGANTAITDQNYRFSYKGETDLAGKMAYEYHVKPRHKRAGLFKGKVFVDPATGQILRAEGTLVKSPSLFVKRVDFVQEYEQVAGFSLPVRIHSVAKTRMFGEAVVDISHSHISAAPLQTSAAGYYPVSFGGQQ